MKLLKIKSLWLYLIVFSLFAVYSCNNTYLDEILNGGTKKGDPDTQEKSLVEGYEDVELVDPIDSYVDTVITGQDTVLVNDDSLILIDPIIPDTLIIIGDSTVIPGTDSTNIEPIPVDTVYVPVDSTDFPFNQ